MEYRQHASMGVLPPSDYFKHLSAMTKEELHSKAEIAEELAVRDMRIKELESQLAAMTKKADGFFDALQLAAKINAEGQAREQQLREALELARNGIQWYMDAFPEVESEEDHEEVAKLDEALALPQDDTALRQWGAELLKEIERGAGSAYEIMCRVSRKVSELEGKK